VLVKYMTASLTIGSGNTFAGNDDRLTATFAALANSTRRAILARLATTGAATVNELAEPFDMQLPAVSKHLKVLERAGLIVRGQHAQFRPCALDAAPLAEVADWTEQYRPVWEARFDRLDDYLAQLQNTSPSEHPPAPGHKETGTNND